MKNLTISIDQTTLEAGREYAKAHNTSLNAFIRNLLRQNVIKEETGNWTSEFFALADRGKGDSQGKQWKREDLYGG
jgi:hypothetical protein